MLKREKESSQTDWRREKSTLDSYSVMTITIEIPTECNKKVINVLENKGCATLSLLHSPTALLCLTLIFIHMLMSQRQTAAPGATLLLLLSIRISCDRWLLVALLQTAWLEKRGMEGLTEEKLEHQTDFSWPCFPLTCWWLLKVTVRTVEVGSCSSDKDLLLPLRSCCCTSGCYHCYSKQR